MLRHQVSSFMACIPYGRVTTAWKSEYHTPRAPTSGNLNKHMFGSIASYGWNSIAVLLCCIFTHQVQCIPLMLCRGVQMSPGRRNERATGGSAANKAGGKVGAEASARGTIGHSVANSGGWQCHQCTFQNAGTTAGAYCTMCGQRRVTSTAATSSRKVGTEVRRVAERTAIVRYGVRTTDS